MIKFLIPMLLITGLAKAATIEYFKDGVSKGLNYSTVTPSLSNPLPVMPMSVSGTRVNFATEDTLSLVNGKLPSGISVAGSDLLVIAKQSASSSPWVVSLPSASTVTQGSNPWVVSMPGNSTVDQGSSPWYVSMPQDLIVKQGTNPWLVSLPNQVVNQGTNPWVVSMPQDMFVKQGTSPWVVSLPSQGANPWIVSAPVASDVKLKDADGANITLGQKTMSASLPVTIASDQMPVIISMPIAISGTQVDTALVGTTPATVTKPANAIGFILQAPDTNTDNIRWRLGPGASTTQGLQLQSGRDTGFIPAGVDVSVCAEVSGTNAFQIQWISK